MKTGASQHYIEIHTEDASGWVVLEAQIDVLGDSESEATAMYGMVWYGNDWGERRERDVEVDGTKEQYG